MPEDWWLGRRAAELGVAVAGTRAVRLRHVGPHGFPADRVWGTWGRDEEFFGRRAP